MKWLVVKETWGAEAGHFKEVILIMLGQWWNLEDVKNATVWVDSKASVGIGIGEVWE